LDDCDIDAIRRLVEDTSGGCEVTAKNRKEIWKASLQVLRESALPNGAIVAANGMFLPPTATPYHFVWGRDASKQLLAAKMSKLRDGFEIRERFLGWITRCVQGDGSSKLFFKRNHLNGPNDFLYNDDKGFQPDNNGSLITAIDDTRGTKSSLDNIVIRMLANGLVERWDLKTHRFTMRQQDLWENSVIDVEDNDFFTHALLEAARGLSRAASALAGIAPDKELQQWSLASRQMYQCIYSVEESDECFYRRLFSRNRKKQIDACLALVLPDAIPDEAPAHVKRMAARTIRTIGEQLLWLPYGARRFEGDRYDGIERLDGSQATGGAWPLLGYAWVRAADKVGLHDEAKRAKEAMDDYLQQLYAKEVLPKYFVPEQLHRDGDERNGKGPLHFAWGSSEWLMTEVYMNGVLQSTGVDK
jgi:GH15 family glucan-1,4-alpha-glucosidase